MTGLPVDGETNWGDVLNNYITNTVYAAALTAQTTINNHAGNIPADPHGDRAYAQGLIGPLTSGVNSPNGLVQLNGSGKIPIGLLPAGLISNIYDVVLDGGAVGNGTTDDSAVCQQVLNAAAAAGGGVVSFPAGYNFALANYLYVGSNTTVYIGGTVSRTQGATTPSYLFTNCQFGTSNAPGTNNLLFCGGGVLDTYGSGHLTSACEAIFLMSPLQCRVRDISFNAGANAPAIELDAGYNCVIDSCFFNVAYGSSGSIPAIRINSSQTATSPTGLASQYYTNKSCVGISISNCGDSEPEWAYCAATDIYAGGVQSQYIAFAGCTFGAAANPSHWNNYEISSQANV